MSGQIRWSLGIGLFLAVVSVEGPVLAEVMPAWRAIGDDASANACIVRGQGQSPVRYGDLTRKGSVELPVDGPAPRVQWDFRLPCDLSKAQGVEFDFRCDDVSCLQGAMFYFKSGKGWYSQSLLLEEDGSWCHVKVMKGKGGVEGQPEGWHRIDLFRIALQRGRDCTVTTAGVADFSIIRSADGRSANVAVIQGQWASQRKGAESAAILAHAANMASELGQLGVASETIADDQLTAERLQGKALAVLAYNPSLPANAVTALEAFVARGGKLFVCYTLGDGISELLGVRRVGWVRSGEGGRKPIAGLVRTGSGLEGQPKFAPQASMNTVVPELTGAGEVVAHWADGSHASLKLPALLRTPRGVYMSHVWQMDSRPEKRALLRAICAALVPGLKAGFAAADAERARVDADVRAFVKSVPGKRGERRLAWCHSARGLGGRDWDGSIRFLKENGFTDVIANLAWADRAYYASSVLPVDPSVATQGDALEQCLAACRKYGVKCHVWRVCYNTGGRIDKERAARFAAEGRLVRMFDEKSRNPWSHTFCPSHPANIKLESQAMDEIAKRGVDGIHFDYIRYANSNFCFCDGCRARFEQSCGVKVANWPADVRKDPSLVRKWIDWRCSNVTKVVKAVGERVHAQYPGVEVSVAARSSATGAYEGDGQDWVGWAKNGWIDFLCPMDYTPSTAFFRKTYLEQLKVLEGARTKLYPGIGLSCWADDGTDAMRMAKHIRALRKDGLEGFTVFNFDARAERAFPILSTGPTRPEPALDAAAPSQVELTGETAEVVIAADAPKSVVFAADEATNFLSRVFGREVPLVRKPSAGRVPVFLGSNSWAVAAGVRTDDLSRDAFRIVVRPDGVYIAGRDDPKVDLPRLAADPNLWLVRNSERATAFGVYEFLERVCGVRFYFPGEIGTVVPRRDRLRLPCGEILRKPHFAVRDLYLGGDGVWPEGFAGNTKTLQWLRLRLDTERIPCCHGQNKFKIPERFAETHPEYFQLRKDGTRNLDKSNVWHARQLCQSSKVWDVFYEETKARLQKGAKYVDIMPQDGMQACWCDACRQAYNTNETHYATDLVWGNTVRLAKRLKAEGVKGCVTQMSYPPYGRIPDLDIPDNVRVMVAESGPWTFRNEKLMSVQAERVRGWSRKMHGGVWMWTYPHKYGATAIPDLPCMAPKAWGGYYKRMADDVIGGFCETECDRSVLQYLNYYVFAKLAWNPKLDVEALLDEHHAKMFGAGAAEMKRFYEDMEEAWMSIAGNVVDTDLGPVSQPPSELEIGTRIYSAERLARWRAWVDAAERAVSGDAGSLARVRFVRAQFLDPLARRMSEYRDMISVEKEEARRRAHPPKFNLVSEGGINAWPDKMPEYLHAVSTNKLEREYLSFAFTKEPHVLKPKTTYRVSFFLKMKDVQPRSRNGGVYFEMTDGAGGSKVFPKGRLVGTTDWIHQTFTFKTGAKIGKSPLLCLRTISATGDVWYRDVLVEEVSE